MGATPPPSTRAKSLFKIIKICKNKKNAKKYLHNYKKETLNEDSEEHEIYELISEFENELLNTDLKELQLMLRNETQR